MKMQRILAYGFKRDLPALREHFGGMAGIAFRDLRFWAGETEPCSAIAVLDADAPVAVAYRAAGVEILTPAATSAPQMPAETPAPISDTGLTDDELERLTAPEE